MTKNECMALFGITDLLDLPSAVARVVLSPDKEDDVYENHYSLNAKSATRPGVCDKHKAPIMDEDEIYSGVWAIVSVTFFGYDVSGNRGVACGLNNIMKFKDGERLGGRSSAESDFADIDMEDDDDL